MKKKSIINNNNNNDYNCTHLLISPQNIYFYLNKKIKQSYNKNIKY